MDLMWALLCVWLLNIGISIWHGRIRAIWSRMTEWSLKQQEILLNEPDFIEEALVANRMNATVIDWQIQNLQIDALTMSIAQISIGVSFFTLLLSESLYIPIEALAMVEAGVIMYMWITVRRYYKTKGMCRGVQALVEAVEIYNTERDNGDQSDSPDNRRDA